MRRSKQKPVAHAPPAVALATLALATGCVSALPESPPPLVSMEEPLDLFAEPDDEAARKELPLGGFTGAYVGDARDTLEAMLDEDAASGVEVIRVVENSPADIAGVRTGDLLLEARIGDGATRTLSYPSVWREVELECPAGTPVSVLLDRAGRRTQVTIEVVPRVRPLPRDAVERLREEQRVGVVVRTATEVEARAAELPPGGGAVLVGLAKNSPWRHAGLMFGDLVVAIDDTRVTHPEVVLDAIRAADETMTVTFFRDGSQRELETPLTSRAQDLRELWIPLLISYEYDRGRSDTSFLLGLFRHEKTAAAWRVRLLWFIGFGGGDADELLEVDG